MKSKKEIDKIKEKIMNFGDQEAKHTLIEIEWNTFCQICEIVDL